MGKYLKHLNNNGNRGRGWNKIMKDVKNMCLLFLLKTTNLGFMCEPLGCLMLVQGTQNSWEQSDEVDTWT
jgi:hypothetical protein